MIPSVLFIYQRELKLDPLDVNILLQLASFWWRAKGLTWPKKQTLADRLDVDPSTIRRRIAALQKRKLIKRIVRFKHHSQLSNHYDLSGLAEALRPYAFKELREKKEKKAKKVNGEV